MGCQSKALKLAQSQGMAIPEYLIGLFCAGQNSRDMITDLSQLAKIPQHEQLRTLRFKYSHPAYGGWPGNTLMVTERHRYTLDKRFRLKLKPLYEFYRCLLCYDQMNVNSDVVCGDPRHIPGDHTAGETMERGISPFLCWTQRTFWVIIERNLYKSSTGLTVLCLKQYNVG